MADPLHLTHQVLAHVMASLCMTLTGDEAQATWVKVLQGEVLPQAQRGLSPMADRLIGTAEGLVAAWPSRGKRGEASLRWAVAQDQAQAVLRDYFDNRAAHGLDRLRGAEPGGPHAA